MNGSRFHNRLVTADPLKEIKVNSYYTDDNGCVIEMGTTGGQADPAESLQEIDGQKKVTKEGKSVPSI